MTFDVSLLARKLQSYREQFQIQVADLATATGIRSDILVAYEQGQRMPSGDDILILADYYKCDYKFFISNERLAPFEQTEILFRRYGDALSKQDRWAVQEFLYLAESEEFLFQELHIKKIPFSFLKKGSYFKQQGEDAAYSLRSKLKSEFSGISSDVYRDFRSIGIHIFRRKLQNSNISGLFINHPTAGKCVLINYTEDIYRQRFTVAHEVAHAILDEDQDVIVSFEQWNSRDLKEIRANTFASRYLLPLDVLQSIPNKSTWNFEKIIVWSNRLQVSTEVLAYALSQHKIIDQETEKLISSSQVPRNIKRDPELPEDLSPQSYKRKKDLLEAGLSDYYVRLCFEAYRRGTISAQRMAEMLLIDQRMLPVLAGLYRERLEYAS